MILQDFLRLKNLTTIIEKYGVIEFSFNEKLFSESNINETVEISRVLDRWFLTLYPHHLFYKKFNSLLRYIPNKDKTVTKIRLKNKIYTVDEFMNKIIVKCYDINGEHFLLNEKNELSSINLE